MKNLKMGLAICLAAITIAIAPALKTFASTETNLKRVEDKVNSVEVSVDNFNYQAKSFQLELKIEGEVNLDTLVWNSNLNEAGIIKNFTYDDTSKMLKIYVTSKKNLVEYSSLKIATISVKGDLDTTYDIKSAGVFKYIYSDKNREGKIDSLASNSAEGFKYLASKVNPPTEDDNNQGGNTGGNGDNNQGGNTGGNGNSNQGGSSGNNGNGNQGGNSNQEGDQTGGSSQGTGADSNNTSTGNGTSGNNSSNIVAKKDETDKEASKKEDKKELEDKTNKEEEVEKTGTLEKSEEENILNSKTVKIFSYIAILALAVGITIAVVAIKRNKK